MNSQFGHVGVVTGAELINSPCHNASPEEKILSDKEGFTEFEYICSECKKPYEAMTFSFTGGNFKI